MAATAKIGCYVAGWGLIAFAVFDNWGFIRQFVSQHSAVVKAVCIVGLGSALLMIASFLQDQETK